MFSNFQKSPSIGLPRKTLNQTEYKTYTGYFFGQFPGSLATDNNTTCCLLEVREAPLAPGTVVNRYLLKLNHWKNPPKHSIIIAKSFKIYSFQ